MVLKGLLSRRICTLINVKSSGKLLLLFASNRLAQTFLRVVLYSKRIRLADKTCTSDQQKVCLADKTCTFGRQNVYVWPTKRVRLAGKTCTFGRQNVYVQLLKLLVQGVSCQRLTSNAHMFGHVSTRLDFENSLDCKLRT